MAFDFTRYNQALLKSNEIHNELLNHKSIKLNGFLLQHHEWPCKDDVLTVFAFLVVHGKDSDSGNNNQLKCFITTEKRIFTLKDHYLRMSHLVVIDQARDKESGMTSTYTSTSEESVN